MAVVSRSVEEASGKAGSTARHRVVESSITLSYAHRCRFYQLKRTPKRDIRSSGFSLVSNLWMRNGS
jgi:hypothetical protein